LIKQSAQFAGQYALFSFLDEDRIGISWVTLHTGNPSTRPPLFSGWRPSEGGASEINGVYYHFSNSLFLIGHRTSTPLARFVTAVPVSAETQDRYGFISGASSVETLFQSFCYLKKLADADGKKSFKHVAGEFSFEEFSVLYPVSCDACCSRRSKEPSPG
jgi:hypothetical protein